MILALSGSAAWTPLAFHEVPEGKTVENLLHLDVGVSDIAEATG